MSTRRKPRRGSLSLPKMSPQRRKVHERALRLGFEAWEVVQGLPAVCAKVSVPVPRWAAEILEHAQTLSHEAPDVVIEALLDMSDNGHAWPRTREARRWGIAMGLWIGHTRNVAVWPLGDAVVDAWRERRSSEPKDAPDHAAAWSAMGIRHGAVVRTASGAVAVVGEVSELDGSVPLRFRNRTGKAMPGTKLTVIAKPNEDHPLHQMTDDMLEVPYIRKRLRRLPWT
ncbi:hypothetical protein [Paraliomyxa miuraensis]|uniref:hypothetical protein n=1 Tax=Paraliomyxa miuraensis TaxID=376150 RepID=UPI00224D2554|nr:hypothetical protein [Paraliomyxa miuraensis]MCX4239608.1 hypothetical protein [Paraliomyxa miuraensis]